MVVNDKAVFNSSVIFTRTLLLVTLSVDAQAFFSILVAEAT